MRQQQSQIKKTLKINFFIRFDLTLLMKKKKLFFRMEIKNIFRILCISVIVLNISGICIIIDAYPIIFDNDALAIKLVITVFIYTLIFAGLAFGSSILKNYTKFPMIIFLIVIGLQISMLIFNSLINPYYWFGGIWGVRQTQYISLLSIIISFFAAFIIWADGLPLNKKKSIIYKLKSNIKPIFLRIGLIWSYLPIITGIFHPMMLQFSLMYTSWIIFQSLQRGSWADSWLVNFLLNPSFNTSILLIIEIIIFIVGLILFILGFFHLVIAKKKKINIVQTGPYKFIRHPQNLAILIMLFPFALYTPGFDDFGIRVGDILSWTLSCLIMIFYSDFEESVLKKKFPEEFENFRAKTGFFFPKIHHKKLNQVKNNRNNYIKRYFFLIITYILFLLIIYCVVQDLLNKGVIRPNTMAVPP